MKRVTLYSSSSRSRSPVRPSGISPPNQAGQNNKTLESPSSPVSPLFIRLWKLIRRHNHALWVVAGGLLALLLVWGYESMAPLPGRITQKDIDRAVLHTLETQTLPSPAAKAYEAIRPSVVRVRGLDTDPDGDDEIEQSVGTGVVIVDKGLILTNLHVVAHAKFVKVVFADGLESEAEVIGLRPEYDLAVLQAKTIPDDLAPANLGSTRDLALGDHVVAVGFPFGIGPSVSAGVVSGLNSVYHSPESKRLLTNLIQFDAAANPGNSGGPLVNANGEVVGIVTAILNPTEQRVFIGIGFAVTMESAATAIGLPPF
ncbi:MAG: trypsin-like peptidase domain-containing protein [Syntrophales bacterium]|nr:trypsin-like peptidase domain-containing protein [Syntrophales bacterium]